MLKVLLNYLGTNNSQCLQVVLQERKQRRLVMLAGIQVPQGVPLVRIDLQLIGFSCSHHAADQLAGVIKVDVLVYEAVYDK